MNEDFVIEEFFKHYIIEYGNFVLKSGQLSNFYVNLKKLISFPHLFDEICSRLAKKCQHTDPEKDIIAGVPVGAIPFASIVSYEKVLPMILVREYAKNHGNKNIIEGTGYVNKNCILIEDVVTSGQSILGTIKKLESNNINIKKVIVIVDRESGGFEKIKSKGYEIESLFKLNEFSAHEKKTKYGREIQKLHHADFPLVQRINQIAFQKKSRLIISLDLICPHEIFKILENIGKYILAVKLHLDMIDFENSLMEKYEFMDIIDDLKKQHSFFIIEDRKYADIASICIKQFENIQGHEIIDMVTFHGICGLDTIRNFENNHKDVGILLIQELSTKDNLLESEYKDDIKKLAKKCKNIVGLVSQGYIDNHPDFQNYTPGINMDPEVKEDGRDQQYRTPEVCAESGTDYFIIGRGIYDNDLEKISSLAKKYQEICWEAWAKYNNHASSHGSKKKD